MTTKEFIRRSDYFNGLDGACISLSGCTFCWRIMQVYGSSVRTLYTHDVASFLDEHPAFFTYCESVFIDKYSLNQFTVELKYFKAFLSRLSKYQRESLEASGKCSHLLAYLQFNDKSIVYP